MTHKKANYLDKKYKWMDKWKLTDPETLKDLPDNPDLSVPARDKKVTLLEKSSFDIQLRALLQDPIQKYFLS